MLVTDSPSARRPSAMRIMSLEITGGRPPWRLGRGLGEPVESPLDHHCLADWLGPSYVGVSLEKGTCAAETLHFGRQDVVRRIWRCPRRGTKLIIDGRLDAAPGGGM